MQRDKPHVCSAIYCRAFASFALDRLSRLVCCMHPSILAELVRQKAILEQFDSILSDTIYTARKRLSSSQTSKPVNSNPFSAPGTLYLRLPVDSRKSYKEPGLFYNRERVRDRFIQLIREQSFQLNDSSRFESEVCTLRV